MIYFFMFFLGTLLGSFLNVVILRLPYEKKSIVWPRSHCVRCKKNIAVYDLIPIFSWFVLRGKCRNCQVKISWRYPFIEAIIGLVSLSLWINFGFSWHGLELFVFIWILIAVAFIDIDTWLIPLSLPASLVVTGLFFADKNDWNGRVLGALVGFLFFAIFLLFSTWMLRKLKRLKSNEFAMGWGDPCLLAGIGAYVGILNLSYVVLFASLQGIIAFAIIKQKATDKSLVDGWKPPSNAIVYGPFLALAGIEVLLWGDKISIIGQQLAIFLGN